MRAIADDGVRGAGPIEQHHTARRGAREVRFHPNQFGRRDRRYDDLWRAGFCLGIDLPLAPERLRELPLRRLGSKTDAVELLSAAGTFLTAVAAVIAVSSIILDEIARSGNAATILSGWFAGASMQIAAGIIARLRADAPSV